MEESDDEGWNCLLGLSEQLAGLAFQIDKSPESNALGRKPIFARPPFQGSRLHRRWGEPSFRGTGRGSRLATYAFTSHDKQHGYRLTLRSGRQTRSTLFTDLGHSPMFAPIVFWKEKSTSFYSLKKFTGDIAFDVAPPDLLKACNYPGLTDQLLPFTLSGQQTWYRYGDSCC
jgi:hypothetical protein